MIGRDWRSRTEFQVDVVARRVFHQTSTCRYTRMQACIKNVRQYVFWWTRVVLGDLLPCGQDRTDAVSGDMPFLELGAVALAVKFDAIPTALYGRHKVCELDLALSVPLEASLHQVGREIVHSFPIFDYRGLVCSTRGRRTYFLAMVRKRNRSDWMCCKSPSPDVMTMELLTPSQHVAKQSLPRGSC